jgi:predicted RNase H-like nuclease
LPLLLLGRKQCEHAFAALWTAERILRGEARSLPPEPSSDSVGLPMRMMY